MKKLIFTIIAGIISAMSIYYLTLEKAEIKYYLSANIPISLMGIRNEGGSIQQLDIRNTGDKEAKDICVKIKARVSNFELKKYSQQDDVKFYKTNNEFEIKYPNLPPDGDFKIVFQTIGDGIEYNNLFISHSNGKAINATHETKTTTIIIIAIFIILGICVLLLFIYSMIIDIYVGRLEFQVNYEYDELLKKKKPIYLSIGKWSKLRKLALEKKLFSESKYLDITKVETTNIYKLLNSEKYSYLTDEEWDEIVDKYNKIFEDNLLSTIKRTYSESELLLLLSINKPRCYLEKNWIQIVDKINSEYIDIIINRSKNLNIRDIIEKLKDDKPNTIKKEYWNDYIKYLKDKCIKELYNDFEYHSFPVKILSNYDLTFLSSEIHERLYKKAYKFSLNELPNVIMLKEAEKFISIDKPDWLKEEDYSYIIDTANTVISYHKKEYQYEIQMDLISSVIYQKTIPKNKPDVLSDDEWDKINTIYNDIKKLEELQIKYNNELALLEEKTSKNNEVAVLLNKQLRIINEVFENPKSYTAPLT